MAYEEKNYDINYNDSRFTKVESQKNAALNEIDKTYGDMISQSDDYFQKQIDAAQDYADKQTNLQNQQTNQTIKEINQQKDQTKKDYIKEQSGAYVDWQKQSNQYGANAEQMAAGGMQNTGFSESAQVSMYNTYQNRVATAREAYGRAVLNYDNSIAQAKLQNSSVLAEIAYNALQQQLELSLQGFQYKNQLLLDKADKKTAINKEYYQRYQDVLDQINKENQLKESMRQYKATHELQERAVALDEAKFAYQKEQEALKQAQIDKDSGGSKTTTAQKRASQSKARSRIRSGKSSSSSNAIKGAASGAAKGVGQTSSSKATIDMKSVLALGYGPISEAKLSSLVDQGIVEQYTSGGKIKFRKSGYALKQQHLFG